MNSCICNVRWWIGEANRYLFVCFVFLSLLFVTTLEQQRRQLLNPGVEKLGLLQLRSSLGLKAKQWPVKLDPCLFWKGIICLNGHVTGISISGFKRTSVGNRNPQFSVDALQNFTFLVSFNASNFALPGSIPDWFGFKLDALQVLDLRSCSIFGSIPSTISNLSSLTRLYLSDNKLSGAIPASLSQLTSLEVLDLSKNSLTGLIPESLASLGNLTLFNASLNSLTGTIPPGIGNLSMLKFLNLSRNSLSSLIPPELGDLSNLIDLDFGFNSLSGPVPPDLRGLRSLQRMVIRNNSLSGPLPVNLFPPLTQLMFLVMSHNDFTGPFPDILWSMPRLRFLDVSGNNFSSTLPKLSSSANTIVTVFNLSRNSIYGSITPVVGGFGTVDLSSNYIEGTVPDYAQSKVMVIDNCLQNMSTQKSRAECASFYAEKGLTFDDFGTQNVTQPTTQSKMKSHKTLIILLVSVGTGVLVLVAIFLVLFIVCSRKKSTTMQKDNDLGHVPVVTSPSPHSVPLDFSNIGDVFTYQQILQATSNFNNSNFMKNGHSGDLFRGILEGEIHVVIKRINLHSDKKEACLSELDFFSKVSHSRFVPFLGHCFEHNDEKFLVYKSMPNGDLSSSLFKKTGSDDDSLQSLDWITRLKIAIGAAEGLSYLHHELTPPFVHSNVEASSILLDDKFEVRLGSLSDVCFQEDNHQNMITRLLRLPLSSEHGSSGTANSTRAYDVYCFGKVLLELVTGKLGMSACSDSTAMKKWLEETVAYISIYDKELMTNILDPSLIIDEDLLEEVWAMAIVAKSCLNPKQSRRPLMRYILKALENPLKVVREEDADSSSPWIRATTSSTSSWNATAFFGSWRSSSDVAALPAVTTSKGGGDSNLIQSGSQGSGGGGGPQNSSSRRRHSVEIFSEPPLDDAQRQNED